MNKKLRSLLNWTLLLFVAGVCQGYSQTPYVGEIRLFGGNFAPEGWAICNGQLLPISEFETLFVLIGTTYGGDGINTFALPNLQGRVVVGRGQNVGTSNYVIGQNGGTEQVSLISTNIPAHDHLFHVNSGIGNSSDATNKTLAVSRSIDLNKTTKKYTNNPPNAELHPASISTYYRGLPIDNVQPSTGITHIISLFGVFPSSN
ncbi:phage tail protein [Flavobacterium sp. NKUCC04_CG]|uniref:phage tail protein n=1 Tax=Flavobacterium sp. NKUCC04_CG TaxID=2842121 RepID=UPI001C5B0C2C|nr:tail fiber protein [Flavobacterium sp. NKUCC04_CG]MBW3517578.1 tail fiber protein [Flavobacterium sp. NKUCC04_CG]